MEKMEQQIEDARLAVINAGRNPMIADLIATYGYDAATLATGLQLCEEARRSLKAQKDGKTGKVNARQRFHELLAETQRYVAHDMKVAHTVFADNKGALQSLHLLEKRTQSYAAWRTKALSFYESINESSDLQLELSARGLTAARIERGLQRLAEVDDAQKAASSQVSHAVQSRYQRDEAFVALNQWMKSFRQFLHLALADEPALLSSVGLRSISRTRKAKDGDSSTSLSASLPTINIPLEPSTSESLRFDSAALVAVS